MIMKRKTITYGLAASAIGIVVAWAALAAAIIPPFAAAMVFVIAFPVLVPFLGRCWRAPGGEGDTPLIGY